MSALITGPERIPRIANEQGGVFTAQQARDEGWTDRQIRRRLRNGRWDYVAGNGLAARTTQPPTWSARQLASAAQLTLATAVTSYTTAALLHGFPVLGDQRSHVTTMARHWNSRNMVVHRVRLTAAEVISVDGFLMITTSERTAVDCLSEMNTEDQLRLWAWVSSREILTAARLERIIADWARRIGNTSLRALLKRVCGGAVSPAEEKCHRILNEAGIGGWSAGVAITDEAGVIGVVDILFARQRLVIEIDGFSAHSSRTAFIQDRRRQNRLVAAGYTVLRFSWDDLTKNPRDVVQRIRRALG